MENQNNHDGRICLIICGPVAVGKSTFLQLLKDDLQSFREIIGTEFDVPECDVTLAGEKKTIRSTMPGANKILPVKIDGRSYYPINQNTPLALFEADGEIQLTRNTLHLISKSHQVYRVFLRADKTTCFERMSKRPKNQKWDFSKFSTFWRSREEFNNKNMLAADWIIETSPLTPKQVLASFKKSEIYETLKNA